MRIALLGTGIMGSGMARNAARAGHDVVVWNRTRDRAEALVGDGVTVADTPARAASGADLLVTMLFDAAATEQAITGPTGAFAAQHGPSVWVQAATVGDGWKHLASLAHAAGVAYLDAPVLGTRGPAEAGELRQLVAGAASAREHAMPVLESWSAAVVVTGDEPGSASRLKLAVNATLALLNGAVAEALVLADRLGVGGERLLGMMDGGAVWAPVMTVKGRLMLDGELEPHFPLEGLLKDVTLARDAAGLGDDELPSLAGVRAALAAAVAAGDGDLDMAAVHRVLRG